MQWSDWEPSEQPTWPAPYVHWASDVFPEYKDDSKYTAVLDPVSLMYLYEPTKNTENRPESKFPVPQEICNPKFEGFHPDRTGNEKYWLTGNLPDSALPQLAPDTILAAIIDVDIGFGHCRFRDKEGKSRVLASWQQSDLWSRAEAHDSGIPFGRTVFQSDINKCLLKHSRDGLRSRLDEWAFNHDMGLADLRRPSANKGLLKNFAHGTHVLGLLGGADPKTEEEFAERVKFIVVNLPPAPVYGEGGAFLDYFLGYGLHWVTEIYGRFMRQRKKSKRIPLAINISFGKQAGPKDEQQDFVRDLVEINKALNSHVEPQNMEMLNIFMPAGNDNLSKGHASCTLEPSEKKELTWVISPDDQSSNFVEIWIETKAPLQGKHSPLQLDVVPPGCQPQQFSDDKLAGKRELEGNLGRIYLHAATPRKKHSKDGSVEAIWYRYRYVICLRAPNASGRNARGAPAGRWGIRMRNRLAESDLQVRMHIQTDAAPGPAQNVIRGSYFDESGYIEREYSGRTADTYTYVKGKNGRADLDSNSFIRRHGTLNSYAANKYVIAVGGFRRSDGRPAPYSGTGFGVWHKGRAIGAPQVLLPSEDGYGHYGLLTDGPTDGSTRSVSGTSFASACAARFVIDRWCKNNPSPMDRDFSVKDILESQAQSDEGRNFFSYWRVDQEKAGAGRLDFRPDRAVRRF